MCPTSATCLSADCCDSELALWNPTKRVGISSSRGILTYSRIDISEKLLNWR